MVFIYTGLIDRERRQSKCYLRQTAEIAWPALRYAATGTLVQQYRIHGIRERQVLTRKRLILRGGSYV
jgi:hypothetical protein